MMHRLILLSFGLFFLCTGHVTKAVDVNGNGLPDLFDQLFPGGAPYAGADPDGDGYSNLQEFLLGGNPLVADVPGMPQVTAIQNTGLMDFTLTWPSQPGLRYRVERRFSSETTWTTLAASHAASSGTQTVFTWNAVQVPDGEAALFRIAGLMPLDSDADGINNWEESVKGTNPNSAVDSDSDGVPDDWETYFFANLTDLTVDSDLDGDGVRDAVEFVLGTSPAHAHSRVANSITGLALFTPQP